MKSHTSVWKKNCTFEREVNLAVPSKLPANIQGKPRRSKLPGWFPPMLAALAKEPFSVRGWLVERHFGPLLVGYYDREKLKYAGKVRTGYSNATLSNLGDRLAGLGTGFLWLRSDKKPEEVGREK